MIKQDVKLIKNNHKIYNKIKSEIVKKNEIYIQDLPSIKELALNKLYELNSYCEQKNVCYFSELPISEEINSNILYWLNTGIELKNDILDYDKINNIRFIIPGVTKLKYELIATRNLREYLKCCNKIESIDLENVYGEYYESYYKKYTKNYDASDRKTRELNLLLNRDIEISDRLGLQQEFLPAQNFMLSIISIGNKKHIKSRLIHID